MSIPIPSSRHLFSYTAAGIRSREQAYDCVSADGIAVDICLLAFDILLDIVSRILQSLRCERASEAMALSRIMRDSFLI